MIHTCFVLFPKFQMLAYVLATETMRLANKSAGRELFTWEIRTATTEAVEASNGAQISPSRIDWEDGGDCSLVLICAGYDPLAISPQGLRKLIYQADLAGAVLGGLDTGAIILAKYGYLSGHQVALHYEAIAGFTEEWPEVDVRENIYCYDRQRLTAVGGIATADAILAWISQTVSAELAIIISDDMAHGTIRSGNSRQRIQLTNDPTLKQMKSIMISHLSEPLAISEIALKLGLSIKQLRLRCHKGFYASPSDYYLRLRLERALNLLRSTEIKITDVSIACGFSSLATFSRSFKNIYKTTPRSIRTQK
ncbi:helix-turn-helix domain-containing protein [Gammaproteobacteria bacterium AS21]